MSDFEELRAADPAREVTPDLARLEASVRSRMTADTLGDGTDEIRARRETRAPAWLGWVATAAAAAVIVGGGGFALGRASDPPSEPAGDVISAGQQAGAPEAQQGGGAAREDKSTASDLGYGGGGFGRTLFTSSGFSSANGSAQAWTFDAMEAFSKSRAAALADALGLKGTPELVDGTWVVGSQDGSGPTLRLEPDGVTSFNFYDPSKDPSMCIKAEEARDLPAETTASTEPGSTEPGTPGDRVMQAPGCDPEAAQPPPAPSGDDAVRKTKDLIKAMGLDLDAFDFEPTRGDENAWMTYVAAHTVVDGQRSGVMWNVSWVAKGLQSVSGALAPAVSLGSYAVISEKDAVARLADPRFGAGGGYSAFVGDVRGGSTLDGVVSDSGTEVSPEPVRTPPPSVKAGSAIAWPVENVTLTKARLGIALHMLPNGASLLLPTYAVSSSDGRSWSVVALADEHLNFAAQG